MNPTKKPAPKKRYPTPTRHGNWQIVNGQCVDVKPGATAPKPAPQKPAAADDPKGDAASDPGARRGR